MRLTFVHTSSILNLRGSERWLLDVVSLLRSSSGQVKVVNFDYDRNYPKGGGESERRREELDRALGGTPLVELSALRLSLPLRLAPLGRETTRTLNRYLNFVPIGRRFFSEIRSSDLIYFLQVNRRPVHLLTVLALATLAGRKRVVAGLHVNPEYTRFQVGALRFFARIGVLKGVHVVNRSHLEMVRSTLRCRAYYVPDGVFVEPSTETSDGKKSEFCMLFVGAMTRVKGADLLPLIDDDLRRRGIPFMFKICTSGGPLAASIQEWSASRPGVSFMGYVEHSALLKVYRQASVAVFPSRREIFGLACVEALASGTPVVVSEANGFHETVRDGYNGYFARTLRPSSFSDGLARVYHLWADDRTRYEALCRNATEHAREHFRWQKVIGEFISVMNDACGVSGGSLPPNPGAGWRGHS